MKSISWLLILLTVHFNNFAQAQQKNIQSAKDVIEKSIEAQGGRQTLESITTMYSESSTILDGREVLFVTKEMAPNKGIFEIVYHGRVVYQSVFDGKKGYEYRGGQKKESSPDDFKDKFFRKHIINEIDYLDTTLYTIELLGIEKVKDEDCYKIKATLKNGATFFLYYSTKTFYRLKEERGENKESGRFNVSYHSEFVLWDNILIYPVYSVMSSDGKTKQEIKLLKLEINKGISNKDFR